MFWLIEHKRTVVNIWKTEYVVIQPISAILATHQWWKF